MKKLQEALDFQEEYGNEYDVAAIEYGIEVFVVLTEEGIKKEPDSVIAFIEGYSGYNISNGFNGDVIDGLNIRALELAFDDYLAEEGENATNR